MKNTLKQQFSYSLLLLFIILCLIFVLFLNPLKKELEAKVFANINVSIQSFMKLSSGILINDFILKQYDSIKATCMDLQSLDGILYIAAFDEQNVLIYQNKQASSFDIKYFDKKNTLYFDEYQFMYHGKRAIAFEYDIRAINKTWGKLVIYYSVDEFVSLLSKIELFVYVFLFSLILVIFILINTLLNKLIIHPIRIISKQMKNMNNSILYTKITLNNKNEIGDMASAFNELFFKNKILIQELQDNNLGLEAKIKTRTLELEAHNDKLLLTKEALNTRINEFHALINSTLEALIVFENDKCTEINYECLKLFGFDSKVEVLGKKPAYFIAKQSQGLVLTNSIKKYRDSYEVFGIKKNAETFCMLLKEDIFISSKKKFKILAILDLTEVKNREKTLSLNLKLASMGEMLENIAHQWRQPLSAISVAASGMELQHEYKFLDEKQFRESIRIILSNTKQLSQTIDTFRDFFKAKNENIIFNLKKTFLKTQKLIFSKYEESNIKLILNLEDVNITRNEIELMQIFLNILNNSKEAFIHGGKEYKRFVFVDIIKENDFAIICIKDNALGIKKEFLERIFEPYFTTKKQHLGTGTSLYLGREIISKQFKGSIEVNNITYDYEKTVHQGCVFKIKLPINNNPSI